MSGQNKSTNKTIVQ